ncbi:MAG: hypothetical protein JWQ50_3259 [Caballeronia mineralivorans]|nr:hypothetical protein [Caballeronia mineralivorans]
MVSAYAVARAVSSSEASRDGVEEAGGLLAVLERVRRSSSINAAARDCGGLRCGFAVARAVSWLFKGVGVAGFVAAFLASGAFGSLGALAAFDVRNAFVALRTPGAPPAFGERFILSVTPSPISPAASATPREAVSTSSAVAADDGSVTATFRAAPLARAADARLFEPCALPASNAATTGALPAPSSGDSGCTGPATTL